MKAPTIALLGLVSLLGCAPLGSGVRGDAQVAASFVAHSEPSAEPVTAPSGLLSFAHVIDDGGLRLVLSSAPEASWGVGAPKLVSKDSPVVVRRAVDIEKVPADLAAAVGRRVKLMKDAEPVCEATISSLALIGRAEPYFGMRGEWEGNGDPARAPLSDAAVAVEAWSLSEGGGRSLAAELGDLQGKGCAEATWARDAAAATPRVGKAVDASSEQRGRALSELRRLPAHAELQSAFESAEPASKGTPWEESSAAELVVSEMSLGEGEGTWVWVSARSLGGCDNFSGSLSALWEVKEGPFGPDLALRYWGSGAPSFSPEAAVDTRGDDHIEILFKGARLRESASHYELEELSIPYHDCPC